ncbi:MAG: hypothetical protein ACHQUC_03670 [Chlamydiales bacterium]
MIVDRFTLGNLDFWTPDRDVNKRVENAWLRKIISFSEEFFDCFSSNICEQKFNCHGNRITVVRRKRENERGGWLITSLKILSFVIGFGFVVLGIKLAYRHTFKIQSPIEDHLFQFEQAIIRNTEEIVAAAEQARRKMEAAEEQARQMAMEARERLKMEMKAAEYQARQIEMEARERLEMEMKAAEYQARQMEMEEKERRKRLEMEMNDMKSALEQARQMEMETRKRLEMETNDMKSAVEQAQRMAMEAQKRLEMKTNDMKSAVEQAQRIKMEAQERLVMARNDMKAAVELARLVAMEAQERLEIEMKATKERTRLREPTVVQQIKSLQQEIKASPVEIINHTYSQTILKLKQKIKNLYKIIDELKIEVEHLNERLASDFKPDEMIRIFSEKIQWLHQEIERLNKNIKSDFKPDEKIHLLHEEIQKLNQEIDIFSKRAESEFKSYERIHLLYQENHQLKQKIEELNKRILVGENKTITTLQAKISEQERIVYRLNIELAESAALLEREKTNFAREISTLKRTLNKEKDRIEINPNNTVLGVKALEGIRSRIETIRSNSSLETICSSSSPKKTTSLLQRLINIPMGELLPGGRPLGDGNANIKGSKIKRDLSAKFTTRRRPPTPRKRPTVTTILPVTVTTTLPVQDS